MSIPKKNLDPFSLEKKRHYFALVNKLLEFKKTYNGTFPEIRNLNTSKLWDGLNDRIHINSFSNPMTNDKLNIVSNYLPDREIKVLDIGCGAGDLENIVFNLQRKTKLNWLGVDISKNSIDACRREFKLCKFKQLDILHKRLPKDAFDAIIALEVLEHVQSRDVFKILNSIQKILKPRGMFIVSVPLNENLEEMLKCGINPNAHVRIYTENILITELHLSGFQVLKNYKLYAFQSLYRLKSLICKYMFPEIRKPNGILLITEKK